MRTTTALRAHSSTATAIRILLFVLAPATAASAGDWEVGIVPGSTGGEYSSLRFDKFGNGHVAYVDEPRSLLLYSFWDHNLRQWFTTNLDFSSGFSSLALDSKQRPHISYPVNGKLKYTHWNGSSWQTQTIPVPTKELTYFTSISLDPNDYPNISYYEIDGPTGQQTIRLRVVAWNGSFWELMTVDNTRGSGKFNSIAVDSTGTRHVAYGNVSYENASLRYAHWDGTSWNNEILEGAGVSGTYRQAVMLILDKQDVPHIAYSDVSHGIVKYATKVGGKWQFYPVGSVGKVAYPDRNGMALDEQGSPYISFYDAQAGVLKVAYRAGQKWISEVVDADYAGFTSSIQVYESTIWVTYSAGQGGGLKFAKRHIDSLDAGIRPIMSLRPK